MCCTINALVRGVPARTSRRGETGKRCGSGFRIEDSEGFPLPESAVPSPSKTSAAPATVSGAGVSNPSRALCVLLEVLPLGARALGKAIRTDPTSPETGLDRWWEMPRGAVGNRCASSLHFLSQLGYRHAGTHAEGGNLETIHHCRAHRSRGVVRACSKSGRTRCRRYRNAFS